MARRTTKPVTFRTRRKMRREQRRRWIALFAAAVLLISAASVFVILRRSDYNLRSAVGGEESGVAAANAGVTNAPVAAGEKRYLLWCAEKETGTLRFVWLLRCRMPARALTALALAPDAMVTMHGVGTTLAGTFASGGARALQEAVEAMMGVPIDRFLGSNESSLANMVNYLGGVSVTVPEAISYRSPALTLVLNAGQQTLKGDSFYKYLCYLAGQGAAGRAREAQVLLDVCAGVCKPQNTDRRSRIFSKMMNVLDTDLSIVDFSTSERAIVALTQEGVARATVALDPAAFLEEQTE